MRDSLVERPDPVREQVTGSPPEPTTHVTARGAAVRTWGFLVAATSLVVVGAALRLIRLDERVLSFDESYTFATAHRPFFDMLATFRFEANGTLYAVLLWPLLRISESEAIVRIPAVIAGFATIPAVYWTGRELVGKHTALLGAAIVAVSPVMIAWSVYGRGYSLAILFAVVSFGCLARAVRGGKTRVWQGLYVLATLVMAYSSVLALALLPFHAIAIGMRVRDRRALQAWGGAALALVVGLLPLFVLLHIESTHRDPLHWLWTPDRALIRLVVGEVAAGPVFFSEAGPRLAGAIVAVVVAIALAGLVVALRRRAGISDWGLQVLLGWAFLPPLLLLVVSQVQPVLWGRYLGIVVPALALLVAAILVRLPKVLAVGYGAALVLLLLTASLMTSSPNVDFRAFGSWMETQRDPSEPLVLYPMEQLPPLAYYARTLRVGGRLPVDEWDDTPLPPGVSGFGLEGDPRGSPIGPPKAGDLVRLASRTGSVFVLTRPNLVDDIPIAWAKTHGCAVEWSSFGLLSAVSVRACAAPTG